MAKAPAFQFYPGDWIQDTRILTPATRGIWIDMLCFMWRSEDRGKLSGTECQLARILSCEKDELNAAIQELSVTRIADVTNSNGYVTVVNRRMHREEKERKATKLRVQRHRSNKDGNVQRNEKETPPSSSSTSSSEEKKEKEQADAPFELPSKEEIQEASELKLQDDVERISKELYEKGIFSEVHAFKNQALKHKKNLRSILHTLSRCYIAKPEKPWGYCAKTIGLEHLNYNERDYQKTAR